MIELAALTKAFRASTAKKRFCAIGSTKANIGHLDVADPMGKSYEVFSSCLAVIRESIEALLRSELKPV